MDNINVNNLNIGVGGMASDPNKNVDIGLDLLTNEKKTMPADTVQKMNYDGASDDSSEISDGDFYKGAVQWKELNDYLKNHNFFNLWEPQNKHTDILFVKK